MAIDASIYNALSQPRKSAFSYQNEFEDQAAQREARDFTRQTNALQLTQLRQSAADDAALREASKAFGSDAEANLSALRSRGLYKAANDYQKQALEARKTQGEISLNDAKVGKEKADAAKVEFENSQARRMDHLRQLVGVNDVQSAHAWLDQAAASGELPPDKVAQVKAQLQANPNMLQQWKQGAIAGGFTLQQQRENEWKQREFSLKQNNELIGEDGKVNQPLLNAKKQVAQAGKSEINVNTGQKGLDNEFKLRGEFKSEPVYKAHQEMQSAYAQIQQSLKQGTPAGDLAGATKIMKLLDPGSVVRESELGMAMAATGLLDRAQNYASNIISGNKLTPRQRQEFQQLADALYGESVKAFNAKRSEYDKLGGEYGLNSGRALGPGASAPGQPPTVGGHVDLGGGFKLKGQ